MIYSHFVFAFEYEVCSKEVSLICDQNEVQQASEKINKDIKSTKEVLFKEILKQRVLKAYDYHLDYINHLDICLDKEKKSAKCLKDLDTVMLAYRNMRIVLGLRDPGILEDHYNERDIDKVQKEIKHLSSIATGELEPLNKSEVLDAVSRFNEIRDDYFIKNNISTNKKKSFSDILIYQKAIRIIKQRNLDRFQEEYKIGVRLNPLIKHFQSAEPDKEEIKKALVKYREEVKRKKLKIDKAQYSNIQQLILNKDLVEAVLKDNPMFCDIATQLRSNNSSSEVSDLFMSKIIQDFINQ